MVAGGQSDDLLAGVGQVEVDALIMAEDAERPWLFGDGVRLVQRLGVEVRVVDGLKDFGRGGNVRRFGRCILRILADIRLASDVGSHLVSGPALCFSVGKVPTFGHASGRGDDADVGQLLSDELDTLATGLVRVRPEQDLTLGER